MAQKARLEPENVINHIMVPYDIIDDLKIETDYEAIVTVNIPYILYVPNASTVQLKHPDAKVRFFKHWTDKAQGSYNFDIIVEDKDTYYSDIQIVTPKIPMVAREGCMPAFTGKNIEKQFDTTGYFRFTTLIIEMTPKCAIEKLHNLESYLEFKEEVQAIVNTLLKMYRHSTKEYHVSPLESIIITDVIFPKSKTGLHVLDNMNLQNAKISNSQEKIDAFKALAANGNLHLYLELLDNAKSSYLKKDYKLAITESCEALDVFIVTFLTFHLGRNGLSDAEIESKLYSDNNWSLKVRLKELCNEAVGKSLPEMNNTLFSKWSTFYAVTRKGVIHKGYVPNRLDAEESISINEKIINTLLDEYPIS